MGGHGACANPIFDLQKLWVQAGPAFRTILGLSSAFFGHVGTFWAMLAPYWAHVELFWAILGAVLSMQGVCKKHRKYQQQIHFLASLLMVFAPFFGLCLFLSFGVCCT